MWGQDVIIDIKEEDSNKQVTLPFPREISSHIFSFLNYSDYPNTALVSKNFFHLTRLARWLNLASLPEAEQIKYLTQLCLNVEEIGKISTPNNDLATFQIQLENYLKQPKIGLQPSALAITALGILYLATNASPDKKKTCEPQLRFLLGLLGAKNSVLLCALIALIKKTQGDFGAYIQIRAKMDLPKPNSQEWYNFGLLWKFYFDIFVGGEYPKFEKKKSQNINEILSALCRRNSKRSFAVEELVAIWKKMTNQQQESLLATLYTWLKNPELGIQPISASKVIGALWAQLIDKKREEAFFALLNFIEHGRVYYTSDKLEVSQALVKNINLLTEQQLQTLFIKIQEWLQTDVIDVAIALLIPMWNKLLDEQHETIYANLVELWQKDINRKVLFPAIPLIWSRSSTEKKQEFFTALLAPLVQNPNSNMFEAEIRVDTLLKIEPHLTDNQKKETLAALVTMFKCGTKFPLAILIFSKAISNSQLELTFKSTLINELNLDDKKTLVEQLKSIGKSDEPLATKHEFAKDTIKLHCQHTPDLDTLRKLKDELEQAHNDEELGFLAARQRQYLSGILPLPMYSWHFHQWQGINPKTLIVESYACSKEWTECMRIFQEYMEKYQDQFNDEDKKFMSQCGSGWYDKSISNMYSI